MGCTDDNFLVSDPLREDALLTNMEELIRFVKAGSILDCSDHEVMAFEILGRENKANIRITAMDFRVADFGFFGDLLRRIP